MLLLTQLNNNKYMVFSKLFLPFFVLGVLLKLSDISNIGADGPAVVSEWDQVGHARIESSESANATMMWLMLCFCYDYTLVSTKGTFKMLLSKIHFLLQAVL